MHGHPALPARRLGAALAALALMAGAFVAPLARAQADFPSRPLTFVVPYPPGGAADVFARQLATQLATRLGQPVVVDNRAGANGNLGSAQVAKAPADGYTLLLGTASTVAINPHLYGKNMPYDPVALTIRNQIRSLVADLLPFSAPAKLYPIGPLDYAMARETIRGIYGRGATKTAGALAGLAKTAWAAFRTKG